MGFKVVMHCDTNRLLSDRGLQKGGAVQCYIDSEVLHYCAPMVPHASGILEGSGETETVVGSGEVRYGTPYGRRQYYENKGKGQRGKLWFQRMKAAHKGDILRGARKK